MTFSLKTSSRRLSYLAFGILVAYAIFVYILILLSKPTVFFDTTNSKKPNKYDIFIIGKAAIAQYFWQHLLNGDIELINNGFFQIGNKVFKNINFTYLSGPGYIQNSLPANIDYMVLFLNGRTSQKVTKAREWLDYLPLMVHLKKVAVILLGNEKCDNAWILKYLKTRGGVVDLLFVVYDTNIVNNRDIFQWPLGVATYRGFPAIKDLNTELIHKKRPYKCNFVGTVYQNSSREILVNLLLNAPYRTTCYVLPRKKWIPEETSASLHHYMNALLNSDFTLCPVGINTECYRIYEAISLGSIPIIEDKMTPGTCGSPLKLFKNFNAPIMYVEDWNTLNKILFSDLKLNHSSILERRIKLINWYHSFKSEFLLHFIGILESTFFKL